MTTDTPPNAARAPMTAKDRELASHVSTFGPQTNRSTAMDAAGARYADLDAAVTALAERAHPTPGTWRTCRYGGRPDGYEYFAADVPSSTHRGVAAIVYSDPKHADVEIACADTLSAAEAREVAARLVEAADRIEARS